MKHIILFFLFAIALVACEKEINIDLNAAATQIIIEGIITDENAPYSVKISKTVNFSDPNNYPSVSGASVSISDDAGNSEKLTEISSGLYQTKTLKGIAGRTYTLNVVIENKTYTAQSKMPIPVPFKGIKFGENNFSGFRDKEDRQTYYVVPQYDDPADIVNNYRFIQYINDKKDDSIILQDDNVSNGKTNEQPLFGNNRDLKVFSGDKVTVEMIGIDAAVYDYLFSLNESSGRGPGGGATPSNPPSNISGGALGYFSAQCKQVKTAIVQ